jgi:hypothetical protein
MGVRIANLTLPLMLYPVLKIGGYSHKHTFPDEPAENTDISGLELPHVELKRLELVKFILIL